MDRLPEIPQYLERFEAILREDHPFHIRRFVSPCYTAVAPGGRKEPAVHRGGRPDTGFSVQVTFQRLAPTTTDEYPHAADRQERHRCRLGERARGIVSQTIVFLVFKRQHR